MKTYLVSATAQCMDGIWREQFLVQAEDRERARRRVLLLLDTGCKAEVEREFEPSDIVTVSSWRKAA